MAPTSLRVRSLVHREVALLVVLSVAATITFGATRSLAAWARRTNQHAGAVWFAESRTRAAAGRPDAAIEALRQAVAADRDNVVYELALARALADTNRAEEAQRLLGRLREAQPEDAEINYRLAHLSALAGDQAQTARYYHDAIEGVVSPGTAFDRSAVRVELTAWLLQTGQLGAAEAEVAALARDLPDTPAAYVTAGLLARRAGDNRRAVTFFQHARRLDPTNLPAALGAGEAAMEADDPATAATEFEAALRLGADRALTQPELDAAKAALAARRPGGKGGP